MAAKPRVTVEVEYGPQYEEGTRRAGAVLRRLIARAADELGYGLPVRPEPSAPPPPNPPLTEAEIRRRPRRRPFRRPGG